MLGVTVGQYRIAQKLGAGGMGVVYLAEHTLLGRPAAVKMLLPDLSRNREVVTRFFNEARAATAIRHPGIVEIYDFGFDTDGAAYIVMEFLRGESLATRAKRGRMSYQSALSITRQVAGALAAAHAAGIVHRDLKPDNVFLVPDPDVPGGERIKLLDFGIAKLAREQTQGMEQMTQTGALMGTPRYMSPEQCRGVAVDHRSDLYSLGCMLFELCTGRAPFVGEGIGDVLSAHIHVAPPLVSSLAPDAPPPLDLLVQRLLVKDPAQRIATSSEVVQAIDHAAQSPGYVTGPPLYAPHLAPRGGLGTAPAQPAQSGHPVPLGAATVATGPNLAAASSVSAPNAGSLTTLSRASLVSQPPAAPPRSFFPWILGAAIATGLGVGIAVLSSGSGKSGSGSAASPTAALTPADTIAAAPPASPPLASSTPPASSGQPDRQIAPTPAEPSPPSAPPPEPPEPTEPAAPAPPAEVSLVIESLPPGAEVVHEGRVLGKTPYRGALIRSEREVELIVRLSGHKDRKLVVRPDSPIAKAVKLDKKQRRSGGDDDRDDSVNPFAN